MLVFGLTKWILVFGLTKSCAHGVESEDAVGTQKKVTPCHMGIIEAAGYKGPDDWAVCAALTCSIDWKQAAVSTV
jgi:hypothetical protein